MQTSASPRRGGGLPFTAALLSTLVLAQPPPEGEPVYEERRQVPVYLLVEADVTAEQLVQAVEAVAHRSTARRMLLTAPLPEPAAPVANDGPP